MREVGQLRKEMKLLRSRLEKTELRAEKSAAENFEYAVEQVEISNIN